MQALASGVAGLAGALLLLAATPAGGRDAPPEQSG
jgi:hypothetical protein